MTHWYDDLFVQAKAFVGEKRDLVINAGLSVSGLQHVGRLRGEIALSQFLTRSLREMGRHPLQSLVLYTQDEWKAKPAQIAQFAHEDGRAYVGRRLIDVPDPFGCHANWVDHYWQDFGGVLDRFAPDVRIVTTTQAYQHPEMQALVRDLASRAEEVRAVVNKYTATYRCPRCGNEGTSSIEKGKLNWRLEWPALWKVYRVDIEPFGKDHATPGGSRDSCAEVAQTIMHFRPPMGIPYEWVGIADRGKDLGDMGSSDFLGFTPVQWVEVGDPEVLRYPYAFTPTFRRIVLDLSRVDAYHDAYDRAEEAFYSSERKGDEDDQARAFELAQLAPPPKRKPFALSYRHAAFLSQISPETGRLEWSLNRMRDTGILARAPTAAERARIARRIEQARVWVEKYATENRVTLLQAMTPDVAAQLDDRDRSALRTYADKAARAAWTEDAIKDSMVSLTKAGGLPVETSRFFRDLYLVLLGSERGPRAAPFLAVLEKDWVLRRLHEAAK
ncbi:MAG: lysine--tRNA ligase [Methanobacteriota archaeon]|nr:MAG: lysine--tRNA ligase [Euryarchaeota archaeon]